MRGQARRKTEKESGTCLAIGKLQFVCVHTLAHTDGTCLVLLLKRPAPRQPVNGRRHGRRAWMHDKERCCIHAGGSNAMGGIEAGHCPTRSRSLLHSRLLPSTHSTAFPPLSARSNKRMDVLRDGQAGCSSPVGMCGKGLSVDGDLTIGLLCVGVLFRPACRQCVDAASRSAESIDSRSMDNRLASA